MMLSGILSSGLKCKHRRNRLLYPCQLRKAKQFRTSVQMEPRSFLGSGAGMWHGTWQWQKCLLLPTCLIRLFLRGLAAERAAELKNAKYDYLTKNHIFVPLVCEVSGVWCTEAIDFFAGSGKPHCVEHRREARAIVFISTPFDCAPERQCSVHDELIPDSTNIRLALLQCGFYIFLWFDCILLFFFDDFILFYTSCGLVLWVKNNNNNNNDNNNEFTARFIFR